MFYHGVYRVFGRVQGVGFRYSTVHRARAIGVTGYVRNLPDGSVAAEAEGTAEQLDALEAFLGEGPSLSRVDTLTRSRNAVDRREYKDFSIR